jgi:hypothetical protein
LFAQGPILSVAEDMVFCHSERSEESLLLGFDPREIPPFARNDKNLCFSGAGSALKFLADSEL